MGEEGLKLRPTDLTKTQRDGELDGIAGEKLATKVPIVPAYVE